MGLTIFEAASMKKPYYNEVSYMLKSVILNSEVPALNKDNNYSVECKNFIEIW
jgi:hypothetical protein